MPIDEVVLHLLRVPLTTPYKLAFGPVVAFDTLLAEVRAGGRSGWGEATLLTGYTDETVDGAWDTANRIAAALPGLQPEAAAAAATAHAAAAPFTATALHTAIEMLVGSPWLAIEQPARVPLLGLLNAMEPEAIEAEVEGLLAGGYGTLKVKVGFDASADARRVRQIQAATAGRARLRLDANQGYAREEACRFAAELEPAGIELFEQPCAAADWDAACAVARVSAVPMMLDESIYGPDDIRRAAELRAARYVKLKLMKMGGLDRLARGLALIRDCGMEPVLGNGVACELGCWMEACVARTGIANAGEMNGFLKPRAPLLRRPLVCEGGTLLLEPGPPPAIDPDALARVRIRVAEYG